jgi:hypothetical protein
MARRDCLNVKVDAALVRKAKVVAAAKCVTLSDYVSALLRERIENDLGTVAAELMSCEDPGRELLAGSYAVDSSSRAQAAC